MKEFDPSDKIIGACEQHEADLDAYEDDFDEGQPYYCENCGEVKREDEVHMNEDDDLECDVCGGLIYEE